MCQRATGQSWMTQATDLLTRSALDGICCLAMAIEASDPVMGSRLHPKVKQDASCSFRQKPHDCGRVPRGVSAQMIGTRAAGGTVPARFQHVSVALPAGPTTKTASAMPGLPAQRACMSWFRDPDSQAGLAWSSPSGRDPRFAHLGFLVESGNEGFISASFAEITLIPHRSLCSRNRN